MSSSLPPFLVSPRGVGGVFTQASNDVKTSQILSAAPASF